MSSAGCPTSGQVHGRAAAARQLGAQQREARPRSASLDCLRVAWLLLTFSIVFTSRKSFSENNFKCIRCEIPGNLRKIQDILILSVQIADIPKKTSTLVNFQFWNIIAKIKQNFENKFAKMRKCLTKFSRIYECGAAQKCANPVDLVKSFQTRIYYIVARFGVDTRWQNTKGERLGAS